jgi:serine-type D-Ala-D-Ala carboxypeptidase (penicillin-binding protein 5/6)
MQPASGPSQPAFKTMPVASTPTRIAAKAGVVADAGTLRLLWSRQPHTQRPIGSLTKVMTALVVLRTADLNRQIRIPRAVLGYGAKYQAESAGLHPGDVLTVRDLLEAMLVESACDAAYVLATAFGPGIPAFVAKMNAVARQLGMMHTQFTSPDGLPYPTEYSTYSTPADLLTLGLAAMKSPVFRSIVAQRFYGVLQDLDTSYGAQLGRRNRKHLTQLGWAMGGVNPAGALLRPHDIDPIQLRAELDSAT